MTNTFRQNPQMTRLVTIETFYPRSHDLNYQHTHTEAVTSESLDSREFLRFFLKFHFSISISSHFYFTFIKKITLFVEKKRERKVLKK